MHFRGSVSRACARVSAGPAGVDARPRRLHVRRVTILHVTNGESAIRLLVLGNPLLDEIETVSRAEQDARIDHAIVATVFLFSRSFEHAPERVAKMRDKLQTQKIVTLAHAVSLALF